MTASFGSLTRLNPPPIGTCQYEYAQWYAREVIAREVCERACAADDRLCELIGGILLAGDNDKAARFERVAGRRVENEACEARWYYAEAHYQRLWWEGMLRSYGVGVLS